VAPVEMRRRLRQIAIAKFELQEQASPRILTSWSSFQASVGRLCDCGATTRAPENHVIRPEFSLEVVRWQCFAQQMLLSDLVITG
jgi:hypothetical protein